MDILTFLREEGIPETVIEEIKRFRKEHPVGDALADRVPVPPYFYYGKEVWMEAITALLSGENLLLVGPKATGKNVLAENLAAAFGRPSWDISFYINVDAAALIGTDTFAQGQVSFRQGPVTRCAREGGFGILDEINMAKNESLAVLHAALDFRRAIDVPGYERIPLSDATRFIGTMNYGYAGTREVNEALASRFMVIQMPVITGENLGKLLQGEFPGLTKEATGLFVDMFQDIRQKCDSGEISSKALDLRGLMASVHLIQEGLRAGQAVELGIVNKCFDEFERQLVADMVKVRIPEDLTREKIFAGRESSRKKEKAGDPD